MANCLIQALQLHQKALRECTPLSGLAMHAPVSSYPILGFLPSPSIVVFSPAVHDPSFGDFCNTSYFHSKHAGHLRNTKGDK